MGKLDFSGVKGVVIPQGDVVRIEVSGTVLWMKQAYVNQVPISTDTDGSVFNGVGYKENVRLSSSGGISSSAQNGSVTTGFIPFGGDTDVIRMKGVEWKNSTANHGGHYYINFYDSSRKFVVGISSESYADGSWDHVLAITRDEATGVETIDFNENYGTTNLFLNKVRQTAFIRINAYGKGEDFIMTINQEIR